MSDNVMKLTMDARFALGLNQRTLGDALGVSRRTVQRWDALKSRPSPFELARLATLVAPKDERLASRIAAAAGTNLEKLGLVAPPVVAALPPMRPPPPPPPRTAPQHLVDVVVCAAAEALSLAPQSVRPALLAAFEKAREVDLTVEEVASVLGVNKQNGHNSKKRR
jgi:DNA-binding XRE family transcriptional regulator